MAVEFSQMTTLFLPNNIRSEESAVRLPLNRDGAAAAGSKPSSVRPKSPLIAPALAYPGSMVMAGRRKSIATSGQATQYLFNWGDGSNTGWLSAYSASHTWNSVGTYTVTAQARDAYFNDVMATSAGKTVVIGLPETVSAPTTLTGEANPLTGTPYTYTTGGSASSFGNNTVYPVQYRFHWGDGSDTGWLPVGTTAASKTWVSAWSYTVSAEAQTASSHVLSAPRTMVVNTSIPTYQLTGIANPSGWGYIQTNPQGLYNAGTQVTVTAVPSAGYYFIGFTGDLTGTTNPQTITMNGPKTVTAAFAQLGVTTIASTPAGVALIVDGLQCESPCAFRWTPQTSHTITTNATQVSGGAKYQFSNRSDGGALAHTITASSSGATYTASFSSQYYLTTSTNPPEGGTISPASGWYNSGDVVPVTATANPGFPFAGFTGSLNQPLSPGSVTMAGPQIVTANFASTPPDLPMSAQPSSRTIAASEVTGFNVSVSSTAGFSGTVAFSVSGLPQGSTSSFNPSTLNSSGSTTLSVSAGPAVLVGSYPLTITASNGALTSTAMGFLTIAAPTPAEMISPALGSNLDSGTNTFTWDAGLGVAQYQLTLGSTPGGADIFQGSQGSTRSASVTLPFTETPTAVYGSLKSFIGSDWHTQSYSYTLNAASVGSSTSSVLGHSPASYSVDAGQTARWSYCVTTSPNSCANPNGYDAGFVSNCEVLGSGYVDASVHAQITAKGTASSGHALNMFDVQFSATQGAYSGTRALRCQYRTTSLTLQDALSVYDSPPQIWQVLQDPPETPGGPFYVTLLGTRFGFAPGLVKPCITESSITCTSTNDIQVTWGPNHYWSNERIKELVTPAPNASGEYDLIVQASSGPGGSAFEANPAEPYQTQSNRGTITVAPTVTITGPSGIAKGGSDAFSVSVSPSNNTVAITLTLSTNTSTTGSATFLDGTTSKVVTGSQLVTVKGVLTSSTSNNIAIVGSSGAQQLSRLAFSVVSVTISIRAGSGQPATDNSGRVAFLSGASGLGKIITAFEGRPQICAAAVEVVGTVSPSNYAGPVTLRRSKNGAAYQGSKLQSTSPFSGEDTSDPLVLDTNPQSGNSGGKVYDLDAPGIAPPVTVQGPDDTITHYRSNFVQFAILGDSTVVVDSTSPKKASADFLWYARTSCTFDPKEGTTLFSDALSSDRDNEAGTGITKIMWDLR